jgi:hypothetical protein
MGQVLLAIFIFLVAVFALFCAAMGVLVWRLGKMNRVDPSTTSPAPLFWLVSPSQSALLHRRLRAAAALAGAATPTGSKGPGSLDDLRGQIIVQARELDRLVAVTARAPRRVRRDHVRALRPQVTELENLSGRLMGLDQRSFGTRPAGSPVDPPEVALRDMAERVAHLERAEEELAAVERANGLLDPEALIADGQPQPHAQLPPPDPSDRVPNMPPPRQPTAPSRDWPPPRDLRRARRPI